MKNILPMLFVLALGIAIACNNSENSANAKSLVVAADTTAVKYQCPMKCQNDTAYTTAGQCPVCEMDLEKL
jgi:hypothetical protein